MFEKTNQTEETMPANLFEDEGDGELDTEFEENQLSDDIELIDAEGNVQAAGGEELAPATGNPIRVKYNGEERDLTPDEAVMYAQKGLNYDHILEERDRAHAVLDKYAELSGLSRGEYLEFLAKNLENQKGQSGIEALRAKFPNADDEVLRELYLAQAKAAEKEEDDARRAEEAKGREPWDKFFARHSDLNAKTLPGEFMRLVEEEGLSPEEAFLTLKNAELLAQIEQDKAGADARRRAIGSLRGDGGKKKVDPFLAGFNAV